MTDSLTNKNNKFLFYVNYHFIMDEKEAIALLKKYAPDDKTFRIVLDHSQAVKDIALRIAEGKHVDMELVVTGSILHDIGRFKYMPGKDSIKHGVAGSDILKKEGLPKHALIAERHIGAGITKEDIDEQGLDIPKKDYIPLSKEEMIITHADNLVDGSKEVPFSECYKEFKEEVSEKIAERAKKLKEDVEAIE
jgi:uncharacterized protein (TIGR00295 family)